MAARSARLSFGFTLKNSPSKMNAKLYHTHLYLPEEFVAPLLGQTRTLHYGRHAEDQAAFDLLGRVKRLPTHYRVVRDEIFEVEVTDNKVTKLGVRLTDGFTIANGRVDCDLILILTSCRNDPRAFFVKTVWLNKKSDRHRTLNPSRYSLA